jgi:hypothetical protein
MNPESVVFWDIMLFGLLNVIQHFGRTKIEEVRNQPEAVRA